MRKSLILIFGVLLLGSGVFLQKETQKVNYEGVNDVYIPPEQTQTAEPSPFSGVEYIALAGVDFRENNQANNSDTMIIARLDHDTKTISLTSLYRDTYLQVSDGYYFKANAAYNLGGPSAYLSMLNRNLDLSVTEYATVDFMALEKVIDGIGGLDVTLSLSEIEEINKHNYETAEACGVKNVKLPLEEGDYHLDGCQSVTYARIRYKAGDDFKRTERQRNILRMILEKAGQMNPVDVLRLADEVLPYITTNIKDVTRYVPYVVNYQIGKLEGFPYTQYIGRLDGASCVFSGNYKEDVLELHKRLGDEDYVPSEELLRICEYLEKVKERIT